MKTWWLEKGWPWLKENWWVLLLLPLLALVAAGMFMMRFIMRPTIIDPLKEADERAVAEAETREKQLEAERSRLEAELADLSAEHASLRDHFEARLQSEVEDLRQNPEKLRQLMLSTGRGQ